MDNLTTDKPLSKLIKKLKQTNNTSKENKKSSEDNLEKFNKSDFMNIPEIQIA